MRTRFGTEQPTVSGLRTRYFPRKRIGHGLISVAPWIDVLLLVAMFLLIDSRFVLRPGFVMEMPSAPFVQGVHPDWRLVMVRLPRGDDDAVIAFFKDERFRMDSPARMQALHTQLAACQRVNPKGMLLIEADSRVPHGTLVRVMEMVHEVGLGQVSVGVRTDRGKGTP